MEVTLKKADESDAPALLAMQKKAFWTLLEKYQDYGTSPAMETIARTKKRIADPSGGFFKIVADGSWAGAMCIRQGKEEAVWIGPIFIDSAFQGKGIAQQAMVAAEKYFPHKGVWKLATLLEEQGNCYLYEKIGYSRIGSCVPINDKATLFYYEKNRLLEEKESHGLPETF